MARKRKKDKYWIQKAIKRKGQLHRDLGVPPGQKIPISKIRAAAKRNDDVGRRARLALTLMKLAKRRKKRRTKRRK
ncbi:MAG: hypothetical protein DRI01_00665 [Chloroflexi bacterium]|nr:MAG: hypothetical protein DRI01_00665 [Chloroflexota bacterium]